MDAHEGKLMKNVEAELGVLSTAIVPSWSFIMDVTMASSSPAKPELVVNRESMEKLGIMPLGALPRSGDQGTLV
jgi:hypothetical protein